MKFLYLLTIASVLVGFNNWSNNNKRRITPIIPLADDKVAHIPLLEVALLADKNSRQNTAPAKKFIKQINKLKKELRDTKRSTARMLLAELLTAYAKLLHRDVQTIHGKLEDVRERQEVRNRVHATRRNIVALANKLLPQAKSKKSVAHILYHKHMARYFLANTAATRHAIVDELARSDYRLLPQRLQQRARLLVALQQSPIDIKTLRRYQRANNRNIAIVAYLGEAMATSQPQAKSNDALYKASARAAALSKHHKRELLVFSVRLWRRASGNKQNWNTPPIKLQNFRNLKATRALIERAALSDWHQGRNRRAIDAYYKLAKDTHVKEYRQKLYKQYLLLAKMHTVEARNSKHFDNALHRLHRDYLAEQKKNKQPPLGGLAAAYLKQVHSKFVTQELTRAQAANYPVKRKQQAIAIAKRLVSIYPDQKVLAYENVAAVYTKMNAHERSADTWMVLVRDTEHKKKYLHRAITAQSTYLNYSAEPRFDTRLTIPAKHINDYHSLRGMYRKLDSLHPEVDWQSKAHLGLLLIAADKSSTAAVLWNRAVVADSDHANARRASAYLLDWYETEQRWVSLEKISRLLLEREVKIPLKQGNVDDKLAKALLQQGIIAQQKGLDKIAIAKFSEYKTFRRAPRLEFVTWQLARLYKKTKQFESFFTTLTDYVVNYPRAKHLRQALLEGGHYAGIMAEENHAVYFYNRFLKNYQNDRAEPRVRKKLIALYQSQGNYYAAISELSLLQKSLHLNAAQRTEAAMQAIELEFRHGSIKNATTKINNVITANIASNDDLGRAYYYKVALTIGKRQLDKVAVHDYKQLLLLEKQILRERIFASNKRFFNDALALITLVKARKIFIPEVKEHEVLQSKNIQGYLQQKFLPFNKGKATYERVCELNRSTICINALYQLARFSEKYLVNIEKINIADTLSGHIVDPFVRKKNNMVNTIKNTIRHAHDTSMRMTRSGKATPLVADQITWLAKNALDFQNLDSSNFFQFSK